MNTIRFPQHGCNPHPNSILKVALASCLCIVGDGCKCVPSEHMEKAIRSPDPMIHPQISLAKLFDLVLFPPSNPPTRSLK